MTDIEPWENETPVAFSSRIDLKAWAEEFRDVYRIAEALCKTPFVPREMIGHQADVAAAIDEIWKAKQVPAASTP